jgi:formylglycine-generating enzyme required for sulfatase activity
MVALPAGKFMMGDDTSKWDSSAAPRHEVIISRPFAVDVFEVTFDEWEACVAAGGCNGYKPSDSGWGRGRRPVVDVRWTDAQAYVAWLRQRTGQSYRLLTEAEWEYAARAGTTDDHYWGQQPSHEYANYGRDKVRFGKCCNGHAEGRDRWVDESAPVGSFAPNPFGLHDMIGNVYEWVEDCRQQNYVGAPSDGSAAVSGPCRERVVRGGSWNTATFAIGLANRNGAPPDAHTDPIGFRIARGL